MRDDRELVGLGGWLWLVGFGLVVTPLRTIGLLLSVHLPIFRDGTWGVLTNVDSSQYQAAWALLLISEIAIDVLLVLADLYLLYLFFSKHRWFPRLYIGLSLFSLVFVAADAWGAQLLFAEEALDPETRRDIIQSTVQCAIWVPYMLVSKRVKLTFVETKSQGVQLAVVGGAALVAGVLGFAMLPKPVAPWASLSMEERLERLSGCGVDLLPDRTIDELLLSFDRADYESDDVLLMLMLGNEVEAEPWGRRFSDDLWYLDLESIDGPGAYARMAERVEVLTRGALPLENVRDHVDLENGVAWLEFDLEGVKYHWDAAVEDDWADPEILSKLAALVRSRGLDERLTYSDFGGQDCLIGFANTKQFLCLDSRTALNMFWLE